MAKLRLSFISAFNERVEPLMNGTIEAEGIELISTYSHPSETFWRQLRFREFEVAEMSMSSYLIARSRNVDMIAIPVFPSRRFFHADLSYHVDSGVKEPGISSANASASANTSKPRRYGRAAYWIMTLAYRNTKSTGTWKGPRN